MKAMRIVGLILAMLAVCSAVAGALPVLPSPPPGGTIVGQIQTTTSGPVVEGTLTFSLTQAAVIGGSAVVVPSQVSCYTDAFGNVVGEPDPLVHPVVTTNTSSGTLAAGTYFTVIAYVDATGTTFYSPETTTVLSAQGSLIVAAPARQPAGATSYKVFIGTSLLTETLQGSVTVSPGSWASFTQSATLSVGSPLPNSNSTICKIAFNDQMVPTFTSYVVSLTDQFGSPISGFPQTWYLSGGVGGTINLSQGTPLYSGVVQYPSAIVATPVGGATQSIAGGLNINGPLTAASANITGPFTSPIFNATTGFQVAGAAAANTFLKGNGTNYVPGSPVLASADFANQGTTTTVLHGNAAGSPSFAKVGVNDVSGSTGSGNFVLDTSPTINTPTFGTSVTLNSETQGSLPHFWCSGFLPAIAATNGFMRCYTLKPVTIEALSYTTSSTPGAGCATQPTVDVCYGTPCNTTSSQMTLTNGQALGDLTGINFAVPANTTFAVRVEVGPAGCSTAWTNVSASAAVHEQ
ncbi:MAG TPA: hypothetical protein VKW06_08860 [Candidatus Angelobacter sp.]|nr:hypothetical protein [Candidatus Angelobacter sp.]